MFTTFNIKFINYIILLTLLLLLPLIHANWFHYRFDETKFLLYDLATTVITILYFYQKPKLSFSKLGMVVLIFLILMLLSMFLSVNIAYSVEYFFRFFNTAVLTLFIYESLLHEQITLKQILNLSLLSSALFLIYYFYGTHYTHRSGRSKPFISNRFYS